MADTIELRCPKCNARPGQRCRALKSGRATDFHKARPNSIGFTGRDEEGRQFCLRCERWKFVALHSCPGVPQLPPEYRTTALLFNNRQTEE